MLQVSRIIIVIVSALLMLLSGCASMVGNKNSPTARATLVTVVDKQQVTTAFGAAVNKFSNDFYLVRDAKGRVSYAVSQKNFPPYACATLWRDINNPYYPRLSAATEDCKPLTVEPEENGGYQYIDRDSIRAQTYRYYLDNWLDVPETEVFRLLGEPDEIKDEGEGKRSLIYNKGINGSPYTDPPTAKLVPRRFLSKCTTTLEIRDGVVFFYKWHMENGPCQR